MTLTDVTSYFSPHQTAVWYPPHGRCTLKSGSLMLLIFLPLILLGTEAVLLSLLADIVATEATDFAAGAFGASVGSTVK